MDNELKLETFILKLDDRVLTTTINEDAKVNMLKKVKIDLLADSLRVYVNNETLFPDEHMFENEANDVEFIAQNYVLWYVNRVCNYSIVKDFINYEFDLQEKTLTIIVNYQFTEIDEIIDKAVYNIGYILGNVGFIGKTSRNMVN